MTKVSDPIVINKTTIKNRLTMAPTVKFDYAGADGKATQKHIDHYRERAEHGCSKENLNIKKALNPCKLGVDHRLF